MIKLLEMRVKRIKEQLEQKDLNPLEITIITVGPTGEKKVREVITIPGH